MSKRLKIRIRTKTGKILMRNMGTTLTTETTKCIRHIIAHQMAVSSKLINQTTNLPASKM